MQVGANPPGLVGQRAGESQDVDIKIEVLIGLGNSAQKREAKDMKILATGASLRMNLGGPSIYHGLIRVLRHVFPGCEIVYHESDGPPETEKTSPEDSSIRIYRGKPRAKNMLPESWRMKWFRSCGASHTLEQKLIREILKADLVVDTWGIAFTDRITPMSLAGALASKPMIRTAALLGIPVVHYTASYGPMAGRWVKLAARQILGKQCALVYCREEQSRRNLLACGVPAEKLLVAPDTGFLMPTEPVPLPGMEAGQPCLGVSVSHQIVRQWSAPTPYQKLIAEFCDRAVRQWKVQVLLIPNELSDTGYDDRAVAREVLGRVRETNAVSIFSPEHYSGPEQKGVISRCDLFVASRYHSIVAALSQAVPTVVIGWHHKYKELLEQFGQGAVELSSETCDSLQLWTRSEDLWNRREKERKVIRDSVPIVERRVYEAGEYLRSLFV